MLHTISESILSKKHVRSRVHFFSRFRSPVGTNFLAENRLQYRDGISIFLTLCKVLLKFLFSEPDMFCSEDMIWKYTCVFDRPYDFFELDIWYPNCKIFTSILVLTISKMLLFVCSAIIEISSSLRIRVHIFRMNHGLLIIIRRYNESCLKPAVN